jgi:hypothetical protein
MKAIEIFALLWRQGTDYYLLASKSSVREFLLSGEDVVLIAFCFPCEIPIDEWVQLSPMDFHGLIAWANVEEHFKPKNSNSERFLVTEDFSPFEPETEEEYLAFCSLVSRGMEPRGNLILRTLWGVSAGRSQKYQVARERRDTFAIRYEQEQGA